MSCDNLGILYLGLSERADLPNLMRFQSGALHGPIYEMHVSWILGFGPKYPQYSHVLCSMDDC